MSALPEDLRGPLADRARIIERCRIFGFKPHPKQWRFIEHDSTKNKAMVGANRSGKTALVCIEAICHAWGIRPYLPRDHPHYRVRMPGGEPIPVPNRGQVAGEDYPNGIGEVIWPTFLEWLPPGSFKIFKRERGIIRTLGIDVSGLAHADKTSEIYPWSIITFRAYEQGHQTFEGPKHHWILDDEPPPRRVWEAQVRGLVDWGGKWMGAMTCLDAAHTWIYDLFMPPKGRNRMERDELTGFAFKSDDFFMVPVSIWDNLRQPDGTGGLTETNILAFAESIDADEVTQAVRIEGKPFHLMRTEFGDTWDPEVNIVPHVEPNPEACHVVLCDAHPTKPYAILFAEVDDHDQWYIWAESYSEKLDSIDKIANFIKETEGWHRNRSGHWVPGTGPFEAEIRLIDPLAKTREKGVGMSAVQQFAIDHELYWTAWRRGNKANRNRRLKEWLRKGSGPRAQPRILVSERCEELIFQIPRYREKMPKDPDQQPRTGEMVDVDADLVQGLIALANSAFTHQMLSGMRGRIVDPDEDIWDYSRRARAVGGY